MISIGILVGTLLLAGFLGITLVMSTGGSTGPRR